MGDDGTNVTMLAQVRVGQADWSPDAKKIAFNGILEEIEGLTIYVMDSDGRNLRMIARLPNSAFVPCWSSDGASIAFDMEMLPKSNIFQVDLDGGNFRRLTAGPKLDERPAFSPDGSKLAFQSNRDGNYEIYVMNLR